MIYKLIYILNYNFINKFYKIKGLSKFKIISILLRLRIYKYTNISKINNLFIKLIQFICYKNKFLINKNLIQLINLLKTYFLNYFFIKGIKQKKHLPLNGQRTRTNNKANKKLFK